MKTRYHSIRTQVLSGIIMLCILLSSLVIALTITLLRFVEIYDSSVQRIVFANEQVDLVGYTLPQDAYFLAAERISMEEFEIEKHLEKIAKAVRYLKSVTINEKSIEQLEMFENTTQTLTRYVDKLELFVNNAGQYDTRMIIVEDIRSVSESLTFFLTSYIFVELDALKVMSQETRNQSFLIILLFLLLLVLILGFAIYQIQKLNRTVLRPIRELSDTTLKFASGDFDVRVHAIATNELGRLATNFNHMAERTQAYIRNEQLSAENLRSTELKLLQEQINPHFLYNTLETLMWKIEHDDSVEALHMVELLSRFFRLSLSGGRTIIPLRDEVEHIISYLSIQAIRYEDLLSYEVDIDENLENLFIPKITLQPLIENALYHGIKPKRAAGKIRITAAQFGEYVIISVIDDGVGFGNERLLETQDRLNGVSSSENDSGIGLINIQDRLKLYYGEDTRLAVFSKEGEGTIVQIKFNPNIRTSPT